MRKRPHDWDINQNSKQVKKRQELKTWTKIRNPDHRIWTKGMIQRRGIIRASSDQMCNYRGADGVKKPPTVGWYDSMTIAADPSAMSTTKNIRERLEINIWNRDEDGAQ